MLIEEIWYELLNRYKQQQQKRFLTVIGVRQCGATYSLYLIKTFPLTKITNYN